MMFYSMIWTMSFLTELRLADEVTLEKKLDLRVLSLGAGVQSSTLIFKLLENEIKPVDIAIFADTGNEPKEVYEWLEYLKKLTKNIIDIEVVRNEKNTGNIITDILSPSGRFASIPVYTINPDNTKGNTRRTCTSEYKIVPIQKKIREILGVNNLRGKAVEMVMGISYDEIQRCKTPPNKWQINCYPFIDSKITRDDCKHWVSHSQYKQPPRSACIICPYHRNEEWSHLKNNYPEEFKQAVWFDEQLRSNKESQFINKLDGELYLHDQRKPLKDVNFDTVKEKQYNLFDDECEGMCGI